MQFIACELNRWSLAEASVSTLLTLAKQNCSLSHWSNVARFITLSIYFKVQNGVLQFRSNNVANGVWKDGEKCVNVNGKATFERTIFGKLSKEFSRELSRELSVQLSLEFTFGIDVSVGSSICVYASTGSNTVYNPNNAGRQPRPSILKTPAIRNSGWRCAKKNEPKELCDFAEEAGRTSSFGDHSQVFASELDGKKQIPLSAYDF